MDIDQRLNMQLLSQDYKHRDAEGMEKFLSIGEAYALAENAIAVVSNLETCASHVFYGGLGERLGIARKGDHHVLDSIWEEEIFCHIHPDDFVRKQLGELHFYRFVKELPPAEAFDCLFVGTLRMNDAKGRWLTVVHRIRYFFSDDNKVWLALCLYSLMPSLPSGDCILNTASGTLIPVSTATLHHILSSREKDVLRLIRQGLSSKMIADRLFISIFTVNRHRQNILDKLHCSNSIAACHRAETLGII